MFFRRRRLVEVGTYYRAQFAMTVNIHDILFYAPLEREMLGAAIFPIPLGEGVGGRMLINQYKFFSVRSLHLGPFRGVPCMVVFWCVANGSDRDLQGLPRSFQIISCLITLALSHSFLTIIIFIMSCHWISFQFGSLPLASPQVFSSLLDSLSFLSSLYSFINTRESAVQVNKKIKGAMPQEEKIPSSDRRKVSGLPEGTALYYPLPLMPFWILSSPSPSPSLPESSGINYSDNVTLI